MSEPIAAGPGIEFEHVWKKFHRGEHHDSLRDLLPALARRMTGRGQSAAELADDDFWAVGDVSFEVRPGDALGIIGRNGAGKSTVLKLLTKILRPNRGSCDVRGRIGALIEVSAGFHQDLTGKENIFLQGAIMGMPKTLIASKFDEIVAFSGVSAFIDTPVKRYSSGMNARLGFSIAAHLDPDVLIIDEVLSVGDYDFQQRAFGRISSMVASGIPVVVVSHQLDRIATLCTSAIMLEAGRVAYRGAPAECIQTYMSALGTGQSESSDPCGMRLESFSVVGPDTVPSGGQIRLRATGRLDRSGATGNESFAVAVHNVQAGRLVFEDYDWDMLPFAGTDEEFVIETDLEFNLAQGLYVIDSFVWDRQKEKILLTGPSVYVNVQGGRRFRGTTQLNAQFSRTVASGAVSEPQAR